MDADRTEPLFVESAPEEEEEEEEEEQLQSTAHHSSLTARVRVFCLLRTVPMSSRCDGSFAAWCVRVCPGPVLASRAPSPLATV
jgi:hypothetical protein